MNGKRAIPHTIATTIFGSLGILAITTGVPQASAQIRVACVGDSITYGVAVSSPNTSYPGDLQTSLGSGYNVQNFGYPGLALMNLPQGNPPYHPPYNTSSQYSSMVAFNPNVIIVMLGTNDASFPVDAAGWSADYLSTFVNQYETLIGNLRNLPAKPTVYIATTPEVYGFNQYGIDPTIANTIITPAIHTIAAATGAPLIDVNTATVSTGIYSGDNVHPNDMGTSFIANTVYTALQPAIASGTNFQIVNQTSGMCVTDPNSSKSSPTPLQQIPCGTGQANGQWQFKPTGNGSYTISNVAAPALAWDDTASSMLNGTPIQLLTAANTTDEQWLATLQPGKLWTFTNLTSGRCLDDTDGSVLSGTQFQQYACAENPNQEFQLVPVNSGVGAAPSAPSNLSVTKATTSEIDLSWTASPTANVTYSIFRSTVSGFTPAAGNQIASGVSLTAYADTGLAAGTTYYYRVEAQNSVGYSPATGQIAASTSTASSGSSISATAFYTVVNQGSGMCVDDTGGSTWNQTVLQQWTCAANNLNQQWKFTPTSNGYYHVTTYNSSTLGWDVVNVSTVPSTPMQLWTYGGGLNQQFLPLPQSSGTYEFQDRNSGLCLYVPGGAATNGLQLQINTCNGSPSELFTLKQQ